MAWVGVIVASAIVLLFSGWWWSVWAFRRYVREYFTDNPQDFMAEPAVAREVGELFGIDSSENDTVEDYVKRLVKETGLPQRGGSVSPLAGSKNGPTTAAAGGVAPSVGGFAGAAGLPDEFE